MHCCLLVFCLGSNLCGEHLAQYYFHEILFPKTYSTIMETRSKLTIGVRSFPKRARSITRNRERMCTI